MLRALEEEFSFAVEDEKSILSLCKKERSISIATGVAAYPYISSIAARMERIFSNLHINVCKITNKFFGESITVAGLLTGRTFSFAV